MINTLVEIEHRKDFDEQGFFSKSYIGYDKWLRREVAVKDIIPKNVSSSKDLEKYFGEATKLSIASHPRILPVYYVGLSKDEFSEDAKEVPRIVTEYLKNGSLNSYLKKIDLQNKTLPLEKGIRFVNDIIQGLIHLHSLNIVHLDLKASNIFIGDDNKLVLADFGQSKFLKNELLTKVKDLYPIINPPENIKQRSMDITADIYQFGVLLYSMFNFRKYREELEVNYKINTKVVSKLFKDNDRNEQELSEFKENIKQLSKDIRAGEFPDRNYYYCYVPRKIRKIINRCLSVNVADRYHDFHEILKEFNDFMYPKGVSNLVLCHDSNEVLFKKDEKDCRICITRDESDKFTLFPHKKDRKLHSKQKKGISVAKLPGALYSLIEEL